MIGPGSHLMDGPPPQPSFKDGKLPVEERIKLWQPTEKNIVPKDGQFTKEDDAAIARAMSKFNHSTSFDEQKKHLLEWLQVSGSRGDYIDFIDNENYVNMLNQLPASVNVTELLLGAVQNGIFRIKLLIENEADELVKKGYKTTAVKAIRYFDNLGEYKINDETSK